MGTVESSELVDAAGTAHRPAGAEPRIVSLVPSLTELLFDLGLGERVVGRTRFCVHPRERVGAVPVVGGTKNVDVERVRRLEPTHVVVNVDENRRETVEEIAAFCPGVLVTHPTAPADNLDLYRLFGGVFERPAESVRLGRELAAALARVRRGARGLPPLSVLYLIWTSPWMTVSRDTYVSRTLALVNWHTVGDDPEVRYPTVELDAGLLEETDLVLFSSEPFPFSERHVEEFRQRWPAPPAAAIDGEIASWYGSRAIRGFAELEKLARRLAARPARG